MEKRINRIGEGQWWTILSLILGGLVVVLVILFVSGFFGTLNKGLETFTPEQIDVKVIACKTFVSAGATESFCNFQKIEKNTYLNCDYSKIKDRLIQDGVNVEDITCSVSPTDFCTKVKEGTVGDIKFNELMTVNGKPCYKEGGEEGEDHWDVPK